MTADALAPCVVRSSVAMVLITLLLEKMNTNGQLSFMIIGLIYLQQMTENSKATMLRHQTATCAGGRLAGIRRRRRWPVWLGGRRIRPQARREHHFWPQTWHRRQRSLHSPRTLHRWGPLPVARASPSCFLWVVVVVTSGGGGQQRPSTLEPGWCVPLSASCPVSPLCPQRSSFLRSRSMLPRKQHGHSERNTSISSHISMLFKIHYLSIPNGPSVRLPMSLTWYADLSIC